ncbi:MAG TPA: Spx/MgsR family RNA polymerase-binding regulatory protein [Agriterribacter sp.]|nr:Spx/MgsR family RNA polymerase-binding regulatory protein [Agriterribacter sp.]
MVTVYGISTCDTTKKAMGWLKKKKIHFNFHNYRESGISAKKLNEWSDAVGWEKLLNKKSTTWRSLTPRQQQAVNDKATALQIMQEYHTLIKRPIIELSEQLIIGWNDKEYESILK